MAQEELYFALILAIIQGITEWLPISSSGHLVLAERFLGYHGGGLTFDVALHFGTLMAVFVYFGKDIIDILQDLFRLKLNSENGKLGILLIVASVPAGIVGFLVKDYFESVLSNLWVVAVGFGVTGMFLLIAAVYRIPSSEGKEKFSKFGYKRAFLVGIVQAISIVPGISRSGSTMAAGVLAGLNEKNAMKFSFLMAIPVVFGANILTVGQSTLPSELIWASFVSFLVGLLTIHVLFKYVLVKRKNLIWFGVYCLILAILLGSWLVLA